MQVLKKKAFFQILQQLLKRRDELRQRTPSSGSLNQFDFIQGDINDSWLLAPLASLAYNKKALKKVVPKDQRFDSGYVGLFRFKFWR